MELNYTLTSAADSVLTPDFRLQLISPGTFHLAISVGASGDTCVRSLPGNDAAVFVAEMMGNDSYQLSPWKERFVWRGKDLRRHRGPAGVRLPGARPAGTVARAGGSCCRVAGTRAAAPRSQSRPPINKLPNRSRRKRLPRRRQSRLRWRTCSPNTQFVFRGEQAEPDLSGLVSRLSISTDNSALALALLPQVSGPPPPPASGGEEIRVPALAEASCLGGKKGRRSLTIFWLWPW